MIMSVTEAELAAGVSLVKDMMQVYRVVTSMGLQVEHQCWLRWIRRLKTTGESL